MLRELRIHNVAVIEALQLPLRPGFTVLTGETGAGKSILIDALQLVLGARSSDDLLRAGSDEAVVEAAFDLPTTSAVWALLSAEGLPAEAGEYLLLRRHLTRDGKSKAYVNGRLTTAATLRALAEHLVDIHGQHPGQPLLEARRHREYLDAFAGHGEAVQAYRQGYLRWQGLVRERDALLAAERERAGRQDLLAFQCRELEGAGLDPEEEEVLEAERTVLANHERLYAAADASYGILEEAEDAVLDRLTGAAARLREAAAVDGRLGEILQALEGARVELAESARELRDYRARLEFDPARLDAIETRLHELGRLKRKYGGSVGELLEQLRRLRRELEELGQSEARSAALASEVTRLRAELGRQAAALSAARRQAASRLESAVQAELADLGMARAAFQVRVEADPAPDGLGPFGIDQVEWLFSPNPGEPPKPLQRIASGGELSRVMLAIRTILAAADATPTVIYDEIDAGIGGSMAEMVGRKLVRASGRHQVLCVTHLPQIACFADRHVMVVKRAAADRTETGVEELEGEGRVREVGRMLRGPGRAAVALEHGRELLEASARLKKRIKSGGVE